MPNDAVETIVPANDKSDGPSYDPEFDLINDATDDAVVPDDKSDDADEEEPVTEPGEEESEEPKEDDEETESKEDEEPVKIPFDRPTVKELKAKYPDIFKDFPGLQEAFFREAQFTKLFPTVEDAQEAFNDNEAFNVISEAALSGNPSPILDSIDQTDKKALEVFSMSFLPSLFKKNAELYYQTITPLFQNLVQNIYNSKNADDNLKNAALVVAEWIFDKDGEDIVLGKKSAAKQMKLEEEQQKLRGDKDEVVAKRFHAFAGEVEPRIDKALEQMIVKGFSGEVFSPFLRKQGAKEVIGRIKKQLLNDQAHMTVMGAWWKRAKNNGYPDEYKDKIISTYLARAKSLIPSFSAKVQAAMLGTKEKAADNKRERVAAQPKQFNSGHVPGVRSNSTPGKVDYRKMSDMDILNSD